MPYIHRMAKNDRIGYAYAGERTPPIGKQERALLDAGCMPVFMDKAPSRDERGDFLKTREPGDVVVICAPFLIGSGAKDIADVLRQLGAQGVAVEVLGEKPVVYTDEAQIDRFAKDAVRAGRSANAAKMVATRSRSGPRSKADNLTDEQWATVKWILANWGHGHQEAAVRYCAQVCGVVLDRHVISRRLAREARGSG